MRLHLLLGSQLMFIPPREPGRNAYVESFSALWQARVLREPYPDLRTLRAVVAGFLRYYHDHKPHRHLRAMPLGFTLATYADRRGHLRLPLARGRVSFIRRVSATGQVEILGRLYFVGKRCTGTYVVATIITHQRTLVIRQARRVIQRYPFTIRETVVAPLVPPPHGRS